MSAFSPQQQSEIDALVRRETGRLETLIRQLQGAVPVAGTGSPAGVLAAPVGTLYRNSTGGTGTSLYVKETGGSTTSGWVAK